MTCELKITSYSILAFSSYLIGCVGIASIILLHFFNEPFANNFGIVIDVNSQDTKLFVYSWKPEKNNNTADVQLVSSCLVKGPDIESYETSPHSAGDAFVDCLGFAKLIIPASRHYETYVFIGVTGLRDLIVSNPVATQQILESIRMTLLKYPFSFSNIYENVRLIDGKEEAFYRWISVNYLLNYFDRDVEMTSQFSNALKGGKQLGSLHLGQETIDSSYPLQNASRKTAVETFQATLFGENYSILSQDYNCSGIKEMINLYRAQLLKDSQYSHVIQSPCEPLGFQLHLNHDGIFSSRCIDDPENAAQVEDYLFNGTSEPSKCISYVEKLFNCSSPRMNAFCSELVLESVKDKVYVANGEFFETAFFLNLTSDVGTISQEMFSSAASDYCLNDWKSDLAIPHADTSNGTLSQYCFNAQFIVIFLKFIGFTEDYWQGLLFYKKIDNIDIEWTMGLMLNSSYALPASYPLVMIGLNLSLYFIALFLLIILVVSWILCISPKNCNYRYSLLSESVESTRTFMEKL